MKEKVLWKILVVGFILCAVGMAMTHFFNVYIWSPEWYFIALTFSGYAVILTTSFVLFYKISIEMGKNSEEVTELIIDKYCNDDRRR